MRIGILGGLLAVSATAWAFDHELTSPLPFLANGSLGGVAAATSVPAYATSSRIAVTPDGGALVIDADSGWLIRTDRAGTALAHVAVGLDAGTLAYDPIAQRAYVADRRGDRIAVVSVGAELSIVASWPTPAEPFGIALAPDRKTLVVATIADRTVIALDPASGKERWRGALDPEPRGVAIAADGAHVAVSLLELPALDQFELAGTHRRERLALGTAETRGVFSVTYLGSTLLAATAQVDVPFTDQNSRNSNSGHYGGSSTPPISHALAFSNGKTSLLATTSINESRAVAWDSSRDRLYVVGLASDRIIQIEHASQVDLAAGLDGSLGTRCGADGLAIAPDGSVLVWCSFPRAIVRVTTNGKIVAKVGPELVASSLDVQQHLGMVMFHTADENVSAFGGLSCGNCHLDTRADGESWLIEGQRLQTPMLAGRMVGTAPFKWDGGAKDLPASLRATVERLGGEGLSKKHIAALAAYLESMPAVRTPTRDHVAVARGKALFESAELGCTQCHEGAMLTDKQRHAFGTTQLFDTPSLVGLAASAPYFHDGSAPTLGTLLRDHGGVHGMASDASAALTDAQVADLAVYLETL